jgi:hypothetical protein
VMHCRRRFFFGKNVRPGKWQRENCGEKCQFFFALLLCCGFLGGFVLASFRTSMLLAVP